MGPRTPELHTAFGPIATKFDDVMATGAGLHFYFPF